MKKLLCCLLGVQIIKSNSIKLDFWSTPKGRFSMRWYIGACVETCRRHVPTLWCDLCPCLLWQAWIIAYCQGSHGFREIRQEDYLWKFVWICGWLFRTRISTNFHEYIFLLNLVEFVWGFCSLRGVWWRWGNCLILKVFVTLQAKFKHQKR